jgi:hypothetical protein
MVRAGLVVALSSLRSSRLPAGPTGNGALSLVATEAALAAAPLVALTEVASLAAAGEDVDSGGAMATGVSRGPFPAINGKQPSEDLYLPLRRGVRNDT